MLQFKCIVAGEKKKSWNWLGCKQSWLLDYLLMYECMSEQPNNQVDGQQKSIIASQGAREGEVVEYHQAHALYCHIITFYDNDA